MSQGALSIVADIYIPLITLMIVIELTLTNKLLTNNQHLLKFRLLLLTGSLASAFGLMAIDNIFQLWASLGLDYSTHSAVALGLVLLLCLLKPTVYIYYLVSLLLYFWLMVLLRYHTALDILSTVLIILPLKLGVFSFAKTKR
ncbi:MAG: hypothetical protein ACI80S_000567 [Pseudohongiellaceae bacterium]